MPWDGLTNGTVPKAVLYDHLGREIEPRGRRIDVDRAQDEDRDDGLDLPHVITFAALYRGAAYSYNHLWDEALKHSRQNAMAMRRDAWLMALLRERAAFTLSRPWHLEVDNPRDPWQKCVCQGMTKIIQGIHRVERMKRYMLQGALWYGRYGSNCKWAWREMYLPLMQSRGGGMGQPTSTPTMAKGKVLTIVKHKPVNGDKIGHHNDDTPYVLVNSGWTDKIRGEHQIIYPNNAGAPALLLRGTWRDQILIHTSDPDDGDYFEAEMAESVHGVGIRSRIYWLDFLRRDYFGAVTEMLNRIGLGLVVIYYDASNDNAKKEALTLAKNFSRRSVIVMPRTNDGVSQAGGVEVVETPMAGASIMLDLQKHVEEQIERFMVGQLISGGGGTSNPLEGTGKAEFASQTKSDICQADATDHDETWTGSEEEPGPVSIIKKWTYSYADFPVRYVTDREEEAPDKKLEAVKTFVDMGGEVAEQEVRELVGLRAIEEGEETLGGKEQMMQLKQMEADAKGQPFGGQPGEEGGAEGPPHGDHEWNDEMKKTVGTEKYAADLFGDEEFKPNPAVDGGHWVTMGAKGGHGGSKVYIVEGRIRIGHPGLIGKRVDAMKEHGTGNPDTQRAWHKKAEQANLEPKHLHQLAADFLAHDREYKDETVKMLKEAQVKAKKMRIWGEHSGYDLRAAVRNVIDKGGDYDKLPGFDVLAKSIAGEFPDIFTGQEEAPQRLWDILSTGSPEYMTEDQAYEEAHGHLQKHGQTTERNRFEGQSDKKIASVVTAKHPQNSNDIDFAALTGAERKTLVESMGRWPSGHFKNVMERTQDKQKQIGEHIDKLKAEGYDSPGSKSSLLKDAMKTKASVDALAEMLKESEAEVPFAADEPTFDYAGEDVSIHQLLERVRRLGPDSARDTIKGLIAMVRERPEIRRLLSARDLAFIQALSMNATTNYSAIFAADMVSYSAAILKEKPKRRYAARPVKPKEPEAERQTVVVKPNIVVNVPERRHERPAPQIVIKSENMKVGEPEPNPRIHYSAANGLTKFGSECLKYMKRTGKWKFKTKT